MTALTADQLAEYRRLGYFTIPSLLTGKEVADVCEEIRRIADRHPHVPEGLIQWEPAVSSGEYEPAKKELGIRKLFHVAKHNEFFLRLATSPKILNIARALAGPSLHLVQAMTLMKPPNCSSDKVWHQDNAYFRMSPCDVFGFWIACEKTTIENGCMHIVPGSHLGGIAPHAGEGDNYGMIDAPEPSSVVTLPMQAGDALIFHGELFHFTPANQTQHRRRAVQLHYASTTCRRQAASDHAFNLPFEIENIA